MKVDSPIDQPVCTASPCASTVHGLTPSPAAMISASPKPKSASPIHSITTDSTGGRKLSGCGALQNKAGTCRTLKNLPIADIRFSAGILQLSRRYFQQFSDIQPSPVKGKFRFECYVETNAGEVFLIIIRKVKFIRGDRDLHSTTQITLQIHNLELKLNGASIASNVPVIAVWIPNKFSTSIVFQE